MGQIRAKACQYTVKYLKENYVFLLIFLIFNIVRFYSLDTPPLYGDEVYVPFVALLAKMHVLTTNFPYFHILGQHIPFGISPQSGGFPLYPQMILLHITANPFAHRILSIIYADFFILFFYSFLIDFFNKKTAIIAVLILTFMPSSVFYSRTDPYFILRLTFLVMMLFYYYKWYCTDKWSNFYIATLVLGLSISTRLEMVMVIISFLVYLFLFNHFLAKWLLKKIKSNQGKTVLACLLFIIGLSPYILFNIYNTYTTFNFFQSESILNNVQFSKLFYSNFVVRLFQLRDIFNCTSHYDYPIGSICSVYPAYLFFFLLIAIVILIICKRFSTKIAKKIGFMIVMGVLIFIQSIPSTSLNVFHNLIILPFFVGAASYVIALIPNIFSVIFLGVILSIFLKTDIKNYQLLSTTKNESLTIYKLVDELTKYHNYNLYSGSWGIARIVYYVSSGKLFVNEIFNYSDSAKTFLSEVRTSSCEQKNIYLFDTQSIKSLNRLDAYRRFIKINTIKNKEKIFYSDYGKPIYSVNEIVSLPAYCVHKPN